jgi:hypothetical protein
MFDQYNEIFLKKDTFFKSQGRMYTLTSNNKIIGTLEETIESTKDMGNQLLKLITLYNVAGITLRVLDNKENLIGVIKKEKGFYKEFKLFSKDNKHLATIEPIVKIKSPMMTVVSPNGDELIKAKGGYGSTDFLVIDRKTNKKFSAIKKRSLVYNGIKKSMVNHDGYYIDNTYQDCLPSLALMAMSIMVDMYFFNN